METTTTNGDLPRRMAPAAATPESAEETAPGAVLTPPARDRIRVLLVDEPGIIRDGLCALIAATEDF
jgi:hypothetical protein